jgi:glyoxylase-like metal-dependent hydrolase (beta-lactamase superfamily II)
MAEVSYKLLIEGLPYKTKNGGFGYSSISLIKDGKDVILFDVGHYAVRVDILKFIKKYKINKVFLSHLHYDHCLNIDLFLNKGIDIYLNIKEWDYLKNIQSNDIYTFRFFDKIVQKREIILFNENFKITKNVSVFETIGHTAGHSSLSFVKNKKKYIIAGDAIKTYKDFKNFKKADVPPYNYKRFIETKKYIIDNFDIIVPGHAGIIKDGKYKQKRLVTKDF